MLPFDSNLWSILEDKIVEKGNGARELADGLLDVCSFWQDRLLKGVDLERKEWKLV